MRVRPPIELELSTLAHWYSIHLGQAVSTADLSASLASEKNILWVVEREGTVCAFLHVIWSGGPYELLALVVDSEHRRRGIGAYLMQTLLAELSTHPTYELWLEVRRDNEAAQHLYRTMGGVENGVRPNYYSDGMDAILMTYSSDADTSVEGSDSGPNG